MIELIQKNNSSGPAIIFGLMCLFQRWQQVKEWLKENGYLSLDIPKIKDCGCMDNP